MTPTQPIVLTPTEVKKCTQIKDTQQGLAQKRAIALLFLHQGNTYLQAASHSNLSIGQVRYLVTSYKTKGMALFNSVAKAPVTSVTKSSTNKTSTTTKAPAPPTKAAAKKAPSEEETDKKAKKKDKKKKDKKSKKEKKQSKKSKKSKKNKKSKKK